jgi:hypothetical protein
MKFIRGLDFFVKAKEDFNTSTGIGGFFTLVALGVQLFLA